MSSYDRPGTTIRDQRDVTVQVGPDEPDRLVTTKTGRQPIRVHRVEIRYDIPGDRLCCVSVYGVLASERDLDAQERRGRTSGNRGSTIERSLMAPWAIGNIPADHCPDWVRDLINANYPGGPR